MPDTKILMIVKSAEARAAYEEALGRIGVAYDIASSFHEVLRLSIDNKYSGLMIDILTLIRSSKEEKSIAYDCINCYPSLRVKWDAKQKSMNLSPLEQAFSSDTQATLAYFIEGRCKTFTARSMRRYPRKDLFLGVLLSTSRDLTGGRSFKTFTVNISQGGAFVHTSESFKEGQTVWLRFLERNDADPIEAVVCWGLDWGICRGIPGIGVMFKFNSQEQADDVLDMAHLHPATAV
jgi:Tfp pilus assembly protein PilZ